MASFLVLESTTLNNLALVEAAQGNFDQGLENYQAALTIARKLGNRDTEATALLNLGSYYNDRANYPQALSLYQEALTIANELALKPLQATILNNLADVYSSWSQNEVAIDYYQQALAIAQEIGDRSGEANTLNNLAYMYTQQSRYQDAQPLRDQALTLTRELGEPALEATIFNNQGIAYSDQGYFPEALAAHQQSLKIRQNIGDIEGQTTALGNLGVVRWQLGQYDQALALFEQALTLAQQLDNPAGVAHVQSNIAQIYTDQENYDAAIALYNQSLATFRQLKDPHSEAVILTNLGTVYGEIKDYEKAEIFLQESLSIRQAIGDPFGEGIALNNLGAINRRQGNYAEALRYVQASLLKIQPISTRQNEAIAYANMGRILSDMEKTELAIAFYKKSVNLREAIRSDLRVLRMAEQSAFTETVAEDYRRLADLLLQQNRVLEAQRVLDLLKVQELDEYLRSVRSTADTTVGIPTLPPEQEFQTEYDSLINQTIALGQELSQLEQVPTSDRTPTQQERVIALRRQQTEALNAFLALLDSPEVESIFDRLRQTTSGETLELRQVRALQDNLRSLDQGAVLFYPLVLEDRLELVLVTADAPPIHRTVEVDRTTLNRTIAEFRSQLQTPNGDPKPVAQQLYDWLIRPLADDLAQVEAETIIYAPDGQLRYIPLTALHSGEQWLVQQFRVNNITATSLTDLNTPPKSTSPQVFAAAYTTGSHEVSVGDRTLKFRGLPYAGIEVDTVQQLLPDTKTLLDEDFTPDSVYLMNDYSIVHLATHATFLVGQPEDSFILFGNGERATLNDLETWQLPNVDLVVLSACETGVGGLGDGREILGLGYQMQLTGARAAISSLWLVSDSGTQELMTNFYEALKIDGMTKAEAIRQAQIALIEGNQIAAGADQRFSVVPRNPDEAGALSNSRLSHPYYWAPFILIGNGL